MQRNISLVRPSLKKYKKIILGISAFLLFTAYPGYLLSKDVSASFVIERTYSAAEEVEVDYDMDFKVYENIQNDPDQESFTEIVIKNIKNAQKEIYIAMYSFNIEEIRDELIEARKKGVNVVIYYHYGKSDDFDEFIGDAKGLLDVRYIAKYEKEEDYYNMHHKFMVIDPGLPTQVLLTGPWNWSHFQQDLDPNILIETHDEEIIKSYMNEVYRISRGFSGYFKFRDLTYVPWEKKITYPGGEFVEIWWSPGRNENSIEGRVINLIKEAEANIDISMTQFDSYNIGKWLIRKAKQGVEVKMIVCTNKVNDEESLVPWLRDKIIELNIENIEIYQGGVPPTEENDEYSIFHHHNMVIDDKTVFTSTANWTFGGFFKNDENSMVIYSKKVAKDFKQIFNNYLTSKII